MEKVKRMVEQLKTRPAPATEQEILNTVREYFQVLILKFIYQSKFGAALSFMGGTCLRICYDLKRYSEDLDFAFDDRKVPYRFSQLVDLIKKQFQLLGLELSSNVHEEKIVQKAYLRFSGLSGLLRLGSLHKEQKLHLKIEVDVRPVPLKKEERESFFVNRFDELFPILKHTLPTLYAGKILAILHRPYSRGRDYYDLIWYLSRKTELNLNYLNRGLKKGHFKSVAEVYEALREKIKNVRPEIILKDIGPFLEDPRESDWITRYSGLFEQLVGAALPPRRQL